MYVQLRQALTSRLAVKSGGYAHDHWLRETSVQANLPDQTRVGSTALTFYYAIISV